MDPNAALVRLRAAVLWLSDEDVWEPDIVDVLVCFEALDEWLSKGGFLPAAWQGRS